jgi:glycosyltransferase involved in cell wall biosynthesis
MKVVMVGPFGLRPRGTMSRRALPLARELAARGHHVKVVLPPWDCPQESGRRWEENGVAVCNVSLLPAARVLGHAGVLARLTAEVMRSRPDVVHFFKPKGYAGMAAAILWHLRAAGLMRGRLVLDSDDWEGSGGWNDLGYYSSLQKRVFRWQETWGMRHCDALTVASRELERLAHGLAAPGDRVFYVPNGVGSPAGGRGTVPGTGVRSQWALGDDPVVLLYSRFFEFRTERVLDVFERVLDRVPAVRLLTVGEGLHGEEDEFLDLAGRAGLGARLVYAGWREPPELLDYFAAADLAICPLEDTLLNRCRCPAKIADLMAGGVPVVAESVGEVGEYIQHLSSGYLVTPGDQAAFVEGIVRLLEDEALRSALGRQAKRRALEKFSWTRLADVVERAYSG